MNEDDENLNLEFLFSSSYNDKKEINNSNLDFIYIDKLIDNLKSKFGLSDSYITCLPLFEENFNKFSLEITAENNLSHNFEKLFDYFQNLSVKTIEINGETEAEIILKELNIKTDSNYQIIYVESKKRMYIFSNDVYLTTSVFGEIERLKISLSLSDFNNNTKSEKNENQTQTNRLLKQISLSNLSEDCRTNVIELKKLFKSSDLKENNFIDENFSKIIIDNFESKVLHDALINKNLPSTLKPYLFDYLKRNRRLESIIKLMVNFMDSLDDDESLDKLESMYPNLNDIFDIVIERDLIVCLIESVSKLSLPRLGYLISKNDYPLPLTYYDISELDSTKLDYKVNFDIFHDLLCLTSSSLVIISGTESTIRCGKSSLIPYMFPKLNQLSIYKMKNMTPKLNTVDILCNEETCDEWCIADFNGQVKHNEDLLFKSLSVFSSLHVINCKDSDFSPDGKPNEELIELFNWYNKIKCETKVLVLFRDFVRTQKRSKLESIKTELKSYYSNFEFMTVENFMDKNVNEDRLLNFKEKFIKNFSDNLDKIERKSFHSIYEIERFYENLCKDENYSSFNNIEKSKIELEFETIFTKDSNKIEKLKNLFVLSNFDSQIEEYQTKANSLILQENNSEICELERKITELKNQKLNLRIEEAKSKYLEFFISILTDQNFTKNLLIFEKCLLKYKKNDFENLIHERDKIFNEISNLDKLLKSEQKEDFELNHKKFKQLEGELKDIDDKIYTIDLTLDRFWDEIFFYFDWLEEKRMPDPCKDILIEKYIDLLNRGYSIHFLRGKPLRVKSKILEEILKKLNNYKNIYVISVIGEQSSAKSSLLNSLFGCDFRTSAGRCTIGIYMNFIQYMDKTLVILDTEGLASIDTSNTGFDNQMATMSVFSSHLIIINHKGEVSTNLENILGITFYAKIHLEKVDFKPRIIFILRDQTSRDNLNVKNQANKLKEKIRKKAEFVKKSIDEVIEIDTNNLYLLPNAFSEDISNELCKKIKWRNNLFPHQILDLRGKLIEFLNEIEEKSIHNSLMNFYTSMTSNWETIASIGGKLFDCKDLEEIKIRNEIISKSNELIEEFRNEISKTIVDLVDNSINELNYDDYDDNIRIKCEKTINHVWKSKLDFVIQSYDQKTNATCYPEYIKNEYRNRIRNEFSWIKDINLNRLKIVCSKCESYSNISKTNSDAINQINKLLENSYDEHEFIKYIEKRLKKIEDENEKKISYLKKDKQALINNIQKDYNQGIHLINNSNLRFKLYEIKDLVEFYAHFGNAKTKMFQQRKSYNEFNLKKKDYFEELKCLKQEKERVSESIPFFVKKIPISYKEEKNKVKQIEVNIKNLEIIIQNFEDDYNEKFGNILFYLKFHEIYQNFPEIKSYSKYSEMIEELISIVTKIHIKSENKTLDDLNILMKLSLCELIERIEIMQDHDYEEEKSKFDKLKNEWKEKALSTFKTKSDAKELGKSCGQNFSEYFFDIYKQKKLNEMINENRKYIESSFKSPTELVEFAYKSSFEISNYENVYKYVTNINRYCLECLIQSVKPHIELSIKNFQMNLKTNMKDIITSLESLKFNISSAQNIYEFLDLIKCDSKGNQNSIPKIIESVKRKLLNTRITDLELFKDGFLTELCNNNQIYSSKLNDDFENLFSQPVKNEIENYIQIFIGCHSTCPGCGSKCQHAKYHDGNHYSNKHILNSFNQWHKFNTNKVCTEFCWENEFYNHPILRENKNGFFKNLEEFLEKKHPLWLFDIKENFEKYGKHEKNAETLKFRREVCKAWMNTRKSLLGNLVDRDYTEEWLNYEDHKNMLEKHHKPIWNDKFNINIK